MRQTHAVPIVTGGITAQPNAAPGNRLFTHALDRSTPVTRPRRRWLGAERATAAVLVLTALTVFASSRLLAPGHGNVGSVGAPVGIGNPSGHPLPGAAVPASPEARRHHAALLLVIDKSGSMSYDPLGGTSKIDVSKQAARLAFQALPDGDPFGVLVFNDQLAWVVPMTAIGGRSDRDQIDAAIATITADGGTEISPALAAGFEAIRRTDADVRRIVLLSDGKSRPRSDENDRQLVAEMVADHITLSTLAIGDDADTGLMRSLAAAGNGRYAFAATTADIPKLLLAEAQSVTTPAP